MEVYYYIPAGEVGNAVECGLKLSRWFDREVLIDGQVKKCMSALLNPRDDMEKYRSADLKCVKLDIPSKYCFAADRYLYRAGLNYPVIMDMYINSIIPVDKYVFGSYRLPECLVTVTAIGGQVSLLDRRLDSPVLFDNSEKLYLNNIIENYNELHDDFGDVMLYYFYDKLAEMRIIDKIEDNRSKIAVFVDKRSSKTCIFKIPDLSGY